MRAVVQRVSAASVAVAGEIVGGIEAGLLVLIGVGRHDTAADADALVEKLVGLRVFADEAGRMNRDVGDVAGGVLVVSQFTLLGEVGKGRRPSFVGAAPPDTAEPLVERVVERLRRSGVRCATGRFGAAMEVALVNDGPVTLVLDIVDGRVR